MASAKEEILARIRAVSRPEPSPVPRDYEQTRAVVDPVGLFVERVAHYKATVHRVDTEGLSTRIRTCLTEREIGRAHV